MGFGRGAVTTLPSALTITGAGNEGWSDLRSAVDSFGRLSVLLFGTTFLLGAISELSERKKKMGAASPSLESPALLCGVCDSIEAMEAPATCVSAATGFTSGFVSGFTSATTGLGDVFAALAGRVA